MPQVRKSLLAPKTRATPQSARRSRPVNWLKGTDAKATKMRRAESWLDYPYFYLVRYPRLQPPSRKERAAERQAFFETIKEHESQIAIHPEARRAVQGLKPRQRKQLAALLIDSLAAFEVYESDIKSEREVRNVASEAPRRLRMLESKRKKAQQALEEWRDYASELHRLLGNQARRTADDCLKKLDTMEVRQSTYCSQYRDDFLEHFASSGDPSSRSMVKLYWFFRRGCCLSANESEVRVAVIRNAFWTRWAKPISYLPKYDGVDSKGCTAVRQAVSRFRLPRGTTR